MFVFWQMENAGYELERLYTDVTSLCSRIELLPCTTARDRLAQSGKSTAASWLLRSTGDKPLMSRRVCSFSLQLKTTAAGFTNTYVV